MTEEPSEQKVQRNRVSSVVFLLVLREMWIGSKDPGYVEHYDLMLFIWGEGLHEASMLSSTLLGFGNKLGPLSRV